MPTKFLYPDTTRDKVMEELDKLVEILNKPKNPETEKGGEVFSKSERVGYDYGKPQSSRMEWC